MFGNPAGKTLELTVYIKKKCLADRSGAFNIHDMSEE
jgi:hypothetical protein